MKLAMLLNFAPRKLGSFEDWLVALAEEARRRGHALDFFGHGPVHPEFAAALEQAGTRWRAIASLHKAPPASIRMLSKYDVLYLNMVPVRDPTALLCYAAWPARVLIGDHSSGVKLPGGAVRKLSRKLLDRLTTTRIDAFAGVSEYVRRRDLRHFSLPPQRARTIYNGIDLQRFSPSPHGADGEPILLAVAHLIRFKGLHHLIDAFARLEAPARLRIAGDGPERDRLREQAEVLGIADRVELIGLRDDVDLLLRECDVFVHPAIWDEAFGLTIAEAMACAKPVIASAIGGIPELIEHGVSGLLVPPGNPPALCAAIERLLVDPDLRARLGENARARVEQRFPLQRCVEAHLRFCETYARRRALVRERFFGAQRPLPAR